MLSVFTYHYREVVYVGAIGQTVTEEPYTLVVVSPASLPRGCNVVLPCNGSIRAIAHRHERKAQTDG